MPICSSLPQALGALAHQAVQRLFGYVPVGVFIETAQRWKAWSLGCAVREGFVDFASASTALLINTKFFVIPWTFADLCDSGVASLRLGELPVSKESLWVIIAKKCVC